MILLVTCVVVTEKQLHYWHNGVTLFRHSTEVTVFSENSPAFFPMYVGQQYVLYLQPKWGRNQVDNCGNSHQTTASEDTASTKQPRLKAVAGF